MSIPEEFEVRIDKDGRIHLDFHGMEESSYKRIVEVLRETLGPVEEVTVEAEEADPATVELRRLNQKQSGKEEEQINSKQGR